MSSFRPEPVTLTGRHVRLEPLTRAHLNALCAVGLDQDLWRWVPDVICNRDDMHRYIEEALDQQARGVSLPFATVHVGESRVVGCTRFCAIVPEHRRVEIGWTFVASDWQRTAVNTEAKLLMMRHAFETWGCRRVELKTNSNNARSRAAILRLGAVEEGTLRSHMVQPDGSRRDTVYFSVIDTEWPAVRARLEARLVA
jgi:N-acetyltransferase